MKLFVIVPFVLLFSFIQAYDFEDSIYNNILISELDEMQWDDNKLLNPRSKRDADASDGKCKSKFFRSCCEEEYFRELYEEDKVLKKECYKEITGKEPEDAFIDLLKCQNKGLKHEIQCIAECVAKKRGILDEFGNLKEAEAKMSFDEKIVKIEWLAAKGTDIFTKCFAAGNKEAATPREEAQCNPATIKYAHCLWTEIQSSCPADRITNEARCKRIMENIASLKGYAA